MNFLDMEAIKKKPDFSRIEKVEVPEWDGYVFVREMSSKGRDMFEEMTFSVDMESVDAQGEKAPSVKTTVENTRARYVVFTACDEKGNLIFKPEDSIWLGEKQLVAVERIFNAAKKVNTLDLNLLKKS